jgi:hypothetical protein
MRPYLDIYPAILMLAILPRALHLLFSNDKTYLVSLLRLNQRVDGLPEMESSEQECNFFVAPDPAVLF